MGQRWENPDYARARRRHLTMIVLALTLASAVAVFWLLRPRVGNGAPPPVLSSTPRDSAPAPEPPAREMPLLTEPEMPPPGAGPEAGANEAWRTAEGLFFAGKYAEALAAYDRLEDAAPRGRGRAGICLAKLGRWDEAVSVLQAAVGARPDDFPSRLWLAHALYRRNELEAALEQVRAALALQRDDGLLELRARLEKEILVQRDYDGARTANFVVLFDGYEHEEMKTAVLDILKDAYAEIGKELDYFPAEPVTVILYTGKDFSDVTRAPEWAGGMFGKLDGKIRLPVQGAAGQERKLRRVLTHEYVHALLHALAPGTPMWLHEGLAQYLSGDRVNSVGQVIPLALLASGFPRDARLAYVAYMESLQAVTDLVDEEGMPSLRRLLLELGAGSGLEAAFNSAYGEPFSRWASAWRPVKRKDTAEEPPGPAEDDG